MYDLAIAKRMVQVCYQSYIGDSEYMAKTLGYDKVNVEVNHDQVGFFLRKGNDCVMVFRGTYTIGGFVDDLELQMKISQDFPGHVHTGFYKSFMALWPWIQEQMTGVNNLIVTGHSLGGALAVLAAEKLQQGQVYTFGCPKIGCSQFAASCKMPHYRVVNNLDIVPAYPPGGYVQCGELQQLGSSNWWLDMFAEGAKSTISSAITNHFIDSYIATLNATT